MDLHGNWIAYARVASRSARRGRVQVNVTASIFAISMSKVQAHSCPLVHMLHQEMRWSSKDEVLIWCATYLDGMGRGHDFLMILIATPEETLALRPMEILSWFHGEFPKPAAPK